MKKHSIRILTWLLVLVMALGGMATAEPVQSVMTTVTTQKQSAVTTITAAAEYLGEMMNLSVQTSVDEDGCQQIAITAPGLENTLLVQIGESAVVVRYGEDAVEISYDVLSEALSVYSYMASGLDAETAKTLYAYVNGGDAQQDEIVLNSILNTELNRLLALVIERGLLVMADNGGFEINVTVENVVSLLAEYLSRAAADEALAASLSQLKLWSYMGADGQTGAQALLAQMAAAAETLKAQPLTGISGSLHMAILAQNQMNLTFDLKADECAADIHAEAAFDGEQLTAGLRANVNGRALELGFSLNDDAEMLLTVAHEGDGKRFDLTGTANDDGMNVEFRMASSATETTEEAVLWNGALTLGEDAFSLDVNTASGSRLLFSFAEETYHEYRIAFALACGSFALDADVHSDYDVFELEASLKTSDATAHLTLNTEDYDETTGKLDIVSGGDSITLNLHGRDDVYTLNGFCSADDAAFSVNAQLIETYRGYDGFLILDARDEDGAYGLESTMSLTNDSFTFDSRTFENAEVVGTCHYELTEKGLTSETVSDGVVQRTEYTYEYTATGMKATGTTKSFVLDESGAETEYSCVYTDYILDGVNFSCDMRVKVTGMEEAVALMSFSGKTIMEANRIAYRIDMGLQGQTAYLEAGIINEGSENENEIRGRLYLAGGTAGEDEGSIDLPFSVTTTDTLTEIHLALESTENGVTESVGSLSVKVEAVIPETSPAHVTGVPITADQLLQLFAQ